MASSNRDKRRGELKKKMLDDGTLSKTETSTVLSTGCSSPEFSLPESVKITSKVPTPEPVYDEPVLSELIIKSYIGEKSKGLFEGEGEAYFHSGHYYQGMFSQGQMHGRGTYVWNDGVRYEGDFSENQITGKGVYTWQDGSTYDGDVYNGKRHGFGIFTFANSPLSYTGDWVMGKRHGKGRMDFDEEGISYYDGDWENGIKHGWGIRQYPSGNVYSGMWFNNVRHGEGTMKWLDRDQWYTGQWENGIQHGIGQHVWLLKRIHHSQYPLRNMYDGDFVNGLRHGYGVFYYANGAKYDGHWKDNMKHGKGKFTFKNGRIYEGVFEKDHIIEYPDFTIDGMTSPDLSQIRTRTPLPTDNVSVHSNESRNTTGPSFQLEIPTLLDTISPGDTDHEANQVLYAITRHVTALRRIYNFYSMLGYEESVDNTFIMNKMQFWRFLKDIGLHHDKFSLTDMDRVIGESYSKSKFDLHNPYEKILQRQFINYLVILAHLVYKKEYYKKMMNGPLLEHCFSRLMTERILRYACLVKGPLYKEIRRATNALVHMDQAYEIYQAICTPAKKPPKENVLKMRSFLFFLKEIGLVNEDLTAKKVIEILGADNPRVCDGEGCFNLELEMTFLEFLEALISCAEVFVTEKVVHDPTTPRYSVGTSHESNVYSVPASGTHISGSRVSTRIHSQSNHEEKEAEPQTQATTPIQPSATHSTTQSVTMYTPTAPTSKTETGSRKNGSFVEPSSINLSGNQRRSSLKTGEETNRISDSSRCVSVAPQVKSVEEMAAEMEGHTGETAGTSDNEAAVDEMHDEEEGDEDDELSDLDPETKAFNFWTHQIHIFFVRKFFPHAERYLSVLKAERIRRLNESKRRSSVLSRDAAELAGLRFEPCILEESQF
ncbi:radial spoke head 10 homolog B-like [Physella acuta]|uniref:radial spoke head 10 homolog B-like n=1 Tax=Physella acuta TaxID=109671 RepID=UPI0027DD6E36|nr:radial spoke head 10 homolog B-like [Physella acuta]